LAREAHLAASIHIGDHHGQLIANHADVFNFFHAFAVKLGDVNETVHAGHDVHEGAKGFHAHDLAGIDIASHSRFAQAFNAFLCDLRANPIG
jgi:hypothetical protein